MKNGPVAPKQIGAHRPVYVCPMDANNFLKVFFLKIEENSTAAKILEHAEAKAVIANGAVEDVAENVAEEVDEVEDVAENVAEDGGVVEDGAENVAEDVADAVPVEPPKKKLRRRVRRKTTISSY